MPVHDVWIDEVCGLSHPPTVMQPQVRSPRGDVTGVLDIAKCLYDAVSRLQRVAERRYSGGGGEELKISMMAELGKRKGRMSKSAMQVRHFHSHKTSSTTVCFPVSD